MGGLSAGVFWKKTSSSKNGQNFFVKYSKYKDLKNVKHWQYVFTKAERKRFSDLIVFRKTDKGAKKEYEEQSGITPLNKWFFCAIMDLCLELQ